MTTLTASPVAARENRVLADRLGGKEPRKVIVKAPKIVSIVPAE